MIKLIKSTFLNERKTKGQLCNFIKKAKILSMGNECKRFEESFTKKQGRKFCVFVSSGSAANLVLIQSLLNLKLLKKGDKIGFSSLTWATNVMPLIQLGLQPVAIDCEIETLNISPRILESYIKDLKALFITNVLGLSDDIKKIKNLCAKNKVLLIEDNCESLGSKVDGKLLGNFGVASTFSFFVGHHLSTIEGGMICTDDKNLYEMFILTRAHGWDRNLELNSQKKIRKNYKTNPFYAKYVFYDLAYNARPTEISGFLGNSQIKYWDKIVSKRESNFRLFNKAIKENDDFIPLKTNHMDIVSNFAMPVICKNKDNLEKYKKRFFDNNVEIRPIIAGDITQQPFYKKYVLSGNNCPNAQFIHKNSFYFPNNPELNKKELNLMRLLLKK